MQLRLIRLPDHWWVSLFSADRRTKESPPTADWSASRDVRLQILIPTFNRCQDLARNLAHLETEICETGLRDRVEILIGDNASQDHTSDVISSFVSRRLRIRSMTRSNNIGLEANAFALLESADAEFVMFLGDDDFLPDGYISEVLSLLEEDSAVGCIIPGIQAVYPDQTRVVTRTARFARRSYPAGLWTVLRLAHFGHQLSGLTFRRANLAAEYGRDPDLRNIYLFVFFIARAMMRSRAWYLPHHRIQVTQGASKDWKYDQSNLAIPILKNYQILFRNAPFQMLLGFNAFMLQQPWRLGGGLGFRAKLRALRHLTDSHEVPFLVKLFLPLTFVGIHMAGLARIAVRIRRSLESRR